jgi:hypothetical protein
MGLFGFIKKDGKKHSVASPEIRQAKNIYQVVGVRYIFCEELYTCVGKHENFEESNPIWSDTTGYSFRSVDQVRYDILQSIREHEIEKGGLIFSSSVDDLTDDQIFFLFPNKQKNQIKLSLGKYLSDYERLVKLTRSRHVELEEIRTDLSDQFGYDVEYAFSWWSRLTK